MDCSEFELPEAVRVLARKTRLLSIADLCTAFEYDEANCEELLDKLVEAGVLRKTKSSLSHSKPYYWVIDPSGSKCY
ncbi:MAG: hypothetical protein M3R04_03020 [bacterium]|nr:hypothetical protein [bacterium]